MTGQFPCIKFASHSDDSKTLAPACWTQHSAWDGSLAPQFPMQAVWLSLKSQLKWLPPSPASFQAGPAFWMHVSLSLGSDTVSGFRT